MADLPNVVRWTAARKQWLLALVATGEITMDDALRFYRISVDEFERWRQDYAEAAEL